MYGRQQKENQAEQNAFPTISYVSGSVSQEAVEQLLGFRGQAPYSLRADENGMIKLNGTTFQCDYRNNRLTVGNVSDSRQVIYVDLAEGGTLAFNRDCVEQLMNAIDMFSPKDITRIMKAIAKDEKLKQILDEIEDETSGLEVREKTLDRRKGKRLSKIIAGAGGRCYYGI